MTSPPASLPAHAADIAATLMDAALTRAQLAAVELEEERLRIARQAIVMLAALFFLAWALMLAVAAIVLLCPPASRPTLVGALAVAALLLAAGAFTASRRMALRKPMLFAQTLAELRKDAAWLQGRREDAR
jgi:uncharacterized membrane protein YqjE